MTKDNNAPKKIENPIDDIPTKEECFIITPIGAGGSDIYVKAMGLIDAVIQPVLDEFSLQSRPANRMQDLGSINKQLITRILEDKLVIANLTGLNPNVMYELAVRHAARKPVIIMAENGTRLPFDLTDQRTIFYSDSLSGVEIAKEELRQKIAFALKDENPDNPIYSVLEKESIFKKLSDDDPLKLIMEKIEKLELNSVKPISREAKASGLFFRRRREIKGELNIKNVTHDSNINEHQASILMKSLLDTSNMFEENDVIVGDWTLNSETGNFKVVISYSKPIFLEKFCSELLKNKFIDNIKIE